MIDRLKRQIDGEIRRFLRDADKRYKFSRIAPLLHTGIKDFVLRDGKRIRPILFLLAYMGYSRGKKNISRNILRCSVAFELLHDFLLVHDDVIDRSDLRRGKPTMHRLFNAAMGFSAQDHTGSGLGIVAGDVIFCLALEAFMSAGKDGIPIGNGMERFIEAAALTGAGEFLDVMNGLKRLDAIKESDVRLDYALKTARYTFEAPLAIGAELAGASRQEIVKLSKIGMRLGIAFQILDDLLDLFLSEKEIGKPPLSDLAEAKKTIVAVGSYRAADKADKHKMRRLFGKKTRSDRELRVLKHLVCGSKASERCLAEAVCLVGSAKKDINNLKMRQEHKKTVVGLVDSVFSKAYHIEKMLEE